MIKSNMGMCQIKGPGFILLGEFEHIIRTLYKTLSKDLGDEYAREAIALAGRNAFCDDEDGEEMKSRLSPEVVRAVNGLADELRDLLNDMEGEQ